MNVDLPPSSAFAPDPAFARPRAIRDPLTLTLPLEQGAVHATHELMSGTISTGPASWPGGECLRIAIAHSEDVVLTITF